MKDTVEITPEKVSEIVRLSGFGLCSGLGNYTTGNMCVEAMVCAVFGDERNHAQPECVSRSVRKLKIALNDRDWNSNRSRGNGMRKLAVAQLNSKGVISEIDFLMHVTDGIITHYVPYVLQDYYNHLLPSNGDRREGEALILNEAMQRISSLKSMCVKYQAELSSGEVPEDRIESRHLSHFLSYSTDCFRVSKLWLANDCDSSARQTLLANFSDINNISERSRFIYLEYGKGVSDAPDKLGLEFFITNAAATIAETIGHAYIKCGKSDDRLNLLADVLLQALIKVKSPGCEFLHLIPA